MPLTAADKKKVNKASIGRPILGTFKLFTGNCKPFILEDCIPLSDLLRTNHRQFVDFRNDSGLTIVSEARRARLSSAPAVQQRTSLGGVTLYSIADQALFAAPQDLVPAPAKNHQDHSASNKTAPPISSNSHLSNLKLGLLVKVSTWLEDISTPIATEWESPNLATQLEFSNFISHLDIDEDDWDLIELYCRLRKSRLRQLPDTMSPETNNTIRGGNNTRSSGNYPRSSEGHTRTTTNTIKDRSGTAARRPKSMPSGSQLPSCWNDEMDEFICHMEAQGEFSTKSIFKALKQRFPELREVSTPNISLWLRYCMLILSFSLWSQKKPSNVASTPLTIRTIITSLKGRRWLLFKPRLMDMRCHLSILPIILSSLGYVSFVAVLDFH